MTSTFRSGSSRRKAETPGKIRIQLKGKNSKVLNSDDEDDPVVDNVGIEDGDDDDDSDNLPVTFDSGIPDDLPEGTFIVQPEPVEDAPAKKKREAVVRIDTSVLDNVSCTACGRQVNPYKGGALQKHPTLKVAICKRCEKFLASGEIAKDKDGTDEQCRWCGEGGRLVVCDECASAFCKACVMRNFNRSEFNNINGQQNWKCYICHKAPLQGLRENYRKIRDTLKALQEKEKAKVVTLAANSNNGTQPSEKSADARQISKSFPHNSAVKGWNVSGAVSAQKNPSSFEGVKTLTSSSVKSNSETSHKLPASGSMKNIMLSLDNINVTFDNVFTVVDKLVMATNTFREMLHVLQSQSQFSISGDIINHALRVRCAKALNMGTETYLKSLKAILSGPPHMLENVAHRVYAPDIFPADISGIDTASSSSASESFALSRMSANPVIMPMGSNLSFQSSKDIVDPFLLQQSSSASTSAVIHMPEIKQEIIESSYIDNNREKIQFVQEDSSLGKEKYSCISNSQSSKPNGKGFQNNFHLSKDKATKSVTSNKEMTMALKDHVQSKTKRLEVCNKNKIEDKGFESLKEVNKDIAQNENISQNCCTSSAKHEKGIANKAENEINKITGQFGKMIAREDDVQNAAKKSNRKTNNSDIHEELNQVPDDSLPDKLAEKETSLSPKDENIATKFNLIKELTDEMLKDKDGNVRDDTDLTDFVKFGEEINELDRLSNKDSPKMKSCQDNKKTKPEEKQNEDSSDAMEVDDNSGSSQIVSDDDVDLATRRQMKKKEILKPAEKTLMPTKQKQDNSKIEDKTKMDGKLSSEALLDNHAVNGNDVCNDAINVADESTKPSRQLLMKKRKASTLEKDEEELEKEIKNSTVVNNPAKRLKPGPKSSKKGMDCDDQPSGEKEKRISADDASDDEDEPPVTFCLSPVESDNQKDLNDDSIYTTKNGSLNNMETGDDASDNNNTSDNEDSDAKKTNVKKSKKIKKKGTKDKDDGRDGNSGKRRKRNNTKIPDAKSSDGESEVDEPKKKKKEDDEDSFKAEESCSSSIESDLSDSEEADGSDDINGDENDGEPKSKKKGKSKARKKQKRKGKGKKAVDDEDDDSEEKDDEEEKGKKKKKDKGKRKIKKMSSSDEGEDPEGKEAEEDDDDDDDDEDDDDPNSSKAGKRKQIRKVMSNKRLEDSTKAAARAEEKRRKRIAAKQREFNIETITDENNPMNCPITTKLVLEQGKEEGDEPIIQVNKNLVRKLKPHQVEAVQFMWDCMYESVKRAKKEQGSGCILAHCMGLGKTLSVISFVHTIMTHEKVLKQRTCLVVSPLNTVLNWKSEWKMWLDEEDQLEVWELASCKQNAARAEALKEWQESGGIMIMGYEMYRNLTTGSRCKNKRQKKVFQDTLVNPGPDLVICDEGHILKNEASAISKAMNQMKTRRRVVLTGTPLQNNLNEYHCMLSFVKPSLLGTRKEFTNRFISPIQNGQCTDSTPRDVKIMKARAHVLHEMLAGCVQRRDYSALTKFLPPKQEYVISVRLTNIQIELYEKYLEITGQGVDGVFSNKGARLFADYQNLMKIWTHPWVLKLAEIRDELKMKYDDEDSFIDEDSDEDRSFSSSSSSSEDDKGTSDNGKASSTKTNMQRGTRRTRAKARRQAGEDSDPEEVIAEWKSKTRTKVGGDDDDVKGEEPDKSVTKEWWAQFVTEDDKLKLELSNKLYLLFEILRMCEEIGDKVLIFSQSILSLNIIESFLEVVDSKFQTECETLTEEEKEKEMFGRSWTKHLDYYRMDGSTSAQNRQLWASNFNDLENYRARLFLISTRAGGLGINLVAANRVIIFDASWNPSHDVQSIFRVYRFGQTKPCYIYRYLAQGTMEEKIYERQVTKLSLSQRVVDEHQIERHFSANDLKELYNFRADKWDDGTEKPTLALPKDPLLAEILTANKHCVVSFHEHDSLLENQVEQTLTEEEKKAAWEEYENEKKGIIIRGPGMERTASWPMMAAAQILSREQITATVQALRQQLPDISEDLFHLHLQQALRRQVQIKQEEMRRMELLRLQEMNYLNMIKQQAQQSGLSHAQSLQAMQNMAPWMQIQRLRAMQQTMLMGGGHLGMLPSASMSLLGQALSNTISNKPEEAIDLDDN